MAETDVPLFLATLGIPLMIIALSHKKKEPGTSDFIMTALGGTAAIIGIISLIKGNGNGSASMGGASLLSRGCSTCYK